MTSIASLDGQQSGSCQMLSALECDAKAAERYCDVPAVSEQRKRIHMIYQRLQAISSDQF